AGTVEAVQAALDGDRRMFAVCQRENVDEASPDVLYSVGVIVRVMQVQRGRGGLQLLIQGEERAQAGAYAYSGEAMLIASVQPLAEEVPSTDDPSFQALDRELRERAVELGRRRGIPPEAMSQLAEGVEDSGTFADLVAFYLDISAADKQDLLELLDQEARMRRVLVAVERDLMRMDAQEEIQQRVQEELGEKQREMVLREQLKAIQRELGEDDEFDEIEELKERIAALELPEAAR